MKNPPNNARAQIEAIKARLKHEYLPEGNIPNSRVARQVDKIDALATLEYAKSQNRPVHKVAPRESSFTIELDKRNKSKDKGYYDSIGVAKYLGTTTAMINSLKRSKELPYVNKNGKAHFLRSDLDRVSNKIKNY